MISHVVMPIFVRDGNLPPCLPGIIRNDLDNGWGNLRPKNQCLLVQTCPGIHDTELPQKSSRGELSMPITMVGHECALHPGFEAAGCKVQMQANTCISSL